MAFEPFGLVGGVTVGIPPVLVIDSNGNVTSNRGNIANLSTAVITSSGNITAPFFIGNIVGNVSGNFVVPGTNTSVIFNQAGNAGASDNLQFNYSTNVLSLTGNLTVTNILTDNYLYANGAPYVFAAQASGTNTQIQFNTAGLLDASANLTFNSSTQTFATDNISAVTAVITELESDNVLVTGNIVAANVIANFIGNLSNANLVSANFLTGVLTTTAQPNITSVGTLSGLTLAGNIIPAADNLYNLGSNVARWKDLFLAGNTIYIGNATIEANATALIFTNPNGSNYVLGGTDFSVTGNISAGGNLTIGNISAGNSITANYVAGTLTTQAQPNITTVGTLGNLSVGGNISTGNISAVTRVTANQFSGLLITSDQPNVTSVGTLSSLNVTGNITTISGRFIGNGSGLSQITAANIVGTVPNATYATNAGTATLATNALNANTANTANVANTATTAETVTTNAQPNITSVGTLTSLTVSGNVNANNFVGNFVGNITSANFASYAGNVTVASQPNITSVGTLTSLAVNGPITAANITANTGRFIGNGSGLSQLQASNIVGTVANATYAVTAGFTTSAGTVTTNAQPNITSVGTLTSLAVNGPITAANITANTGRFIGNGSGLSQLQASNIVGTVANATYAVTAGFTTSAGTVTTNAQPNITSVGTLTSLVVSGNITGSNIAGGNVVSANFFTGVLTTSVQPNITSVGTLSSLAVSGNITSANITATTGRFAGNGSGLTNLSGANVVGTVANATYALTAGSTTTAGTVTTNAQPNITSVGTLTSLIVSGNITGANVSGGNLVSANYITGTLTTPAQPNITSVGTLTSLNVTGNITSANITATTGRFAGNGSGLTNLSGANVVGNVANATYAVSAGSANTAGTVTTNAQPNITSVGTLTSLIVSGNITGSNVAGGNLVSANYVTGILTTSSQPNVTSVGTLSSLNVNGNITSANITSIAGRFAGNGSGLTNLSGANVVGTVANATYAVSADTSTTANTVIDNAQPNITSVGTLTSLVVSGNITGANINGGNLVSANYFSGTLTTNAQANITLVGTLNSLAVNGPITAANITANTGRFTGNGSGLTNLFGGNVVGTVANATYSVSAGSSLTADTVIDNAQPNITSVGTLTSLTSSGNITAPFFIGNIVGNISGNFVVPGTNTSVIFNQEGNAGASNALKFNYSSNVLTVIGNVVANYFIGNGSRLSQLTGANVIGNVANATYAVTAGFTTTAGTVTTNAQPNITSVGLLTTLSVNGNITGSNIAVGNLVSANYITGVLTTGAQPNVTSVGTLSSLAVNGNITAENITANTGRFTGNGSGLTNLFGGNVVGTVANATYSVSAGNSATAGTVTTNAQPNITSIGTLTSLAVSGNITGANVNGGNLVSANYVAGTLTTGAQPNITSLGTLTSLVVNGNITSVNFTSIAGRFAGNGSGLSNLAGANVVGDVANATYAVTSGSTTTAGTVTTNAQPNITSVGTLTSLVVSGNITGANVSGGNLVSANYVTGTLTTNAQPNITSLGTLTSLTSSGNITAPYFFGNLIGNIDDANYAAYAGNVVNPLQPNITSLGTLTDLSVSGNIIGGNLVSANFLTGTLTTQTQSNIHTVGNLGFLNVDTTVFGANGNITFNGSMSGIGTQSDIDITGDLYVSNIYSTIIAGVLSTNEQPNITLVGTLTELTVEGPVNLGSVANITITGGTANYILTTDGAGNLSWEPPGSGTAAGSNTQVQFNDEGLLAGNSTFTFNNVTKTLTVLGNILSNNTIQASKFTSNVATGTAPFTVTSTTKVANLSVETANTASFATNSTNSNVALTVANAAQPNITSLGTLTSLNVNGAGSITGNIRVGNLDTNGTIVSTNSTVVGNANVNGTLQVGSAGQLKVLGTINTASSSNVFLGSVSNIHIEGGINGYVLSTDGAGNLSWSAGGGGGGNGVPGGANTQIQYNDSGVFGGSSFLTFNEVTNTLQIAGNLIANSTQVGAGIYKFSTQYVYFATTVSAASDQILWSTQAANVSGVDFHVIATDATGSTRQSAKISSLYYGNSVVFNEYGGLQLNGGTGSFSVEYDAGDIITPPSIRLLVTPDSANSTTYKMMITEYAP